MARLAARLGGGETDPDDDEAGALHGGSGMAPGSPLDPAAWAAVVARAPRLAFEFEYDGVGPVEWRADCPPPPGVAAAFGAIAAAGAAVAAQHEDAIDAAVDAWMASVEGGGDDDGGVAVPAARDDAHSDTASSLDGASLRSHSVHFDHDAGAAALAAQASAHALDAPSLPASPSHLYPTAASLARERAATRAVLASATPTSQLHHTPGATQGGDSQAAAMGAHRHATTAYRVATLFGKSRVAKVAVSPVALRDAHAAPHAGRAGSAAAGGVGARALHHPDTERRWRVRPTGAADPVALYAATQAVRSRLAARLAATRRRRARSSSGPSGGGSGNGSGSGHVRRALAPYFGSPSPAAPAPGGTPGSSDREAMAEMAARMEWGAAMDDGYAYELASVAGGDDAGYYDDDGVDYDEDAAAADASYAGETAAGGSDRLSRWSSPPTAPPTHAAPPGSSHRFAASASRAGGAVTRRLDFS